MIRAFKSARSPPQRLCRTRSAGIPKGLISPGAAPFCQGRTRSVVAEKDPPKPWVAKARRRSRDLQKTHILWTSARKIPKMKTLDSGRNETGLGRGKACIDLSHPAFLRRTGHPVAPPWPQFSQRRFENPSGLFLCRRAGRRPAGCRNSLSRGVRFSSANLSGSYLHARRRKDDHA